MKEKWFKPEFSFDGVLLLGYVVGSIFFISGMYYQLESNGRSIHAISKTQNQVLHCLQQTKDVIQADHSNKLDIVIPDAPIFDETYPAAPIAAKNHYE